MKKKILLAIVGLFIITGCGFSNDNNKKNNQEDNKIDAIKVEADDIVVNLDSIRNLYKLSFKYDSKAHYMEGANYYMMDYYVNNSIQLRISIEFKNNMAPKDVMSSRNAAQKDTKKINGIEWIYYEGKTQNNDNTYYYLHQVNNDTYQVAFVTTRNVNDLTNIFMNNVILK